ncbi:hypothetical protein [Chitinibacter sp. S2-10]|uniref:hypothetical protein n=1 Tax=Chitinibacter sp. S2-10 TaxID=3373597 RepID=UPI003977645F
MLPIDTPDNLFHDGNPATATLGTILTAAFLNGVQGELLSIQAAAGIAPDVAQNQVLTAIQSGKLTSGAAGGTADALTMTLANSGLTALTDRMSILVIASAVNATTAPTLNLTLGTTATGVKTIVKGADRPLVPGDIPGANYPLLLVWSATLGKWVLTNPASSIDLVSRMGSAGGLSFRNLLINAGGTFNQRGYVSGAATTAANQYTLDRWRVVVSGQNLSWVANGAVNVMTAPAGGVEQVIEGLNVLGGTYVLNWTGTATAKVNGVDVAKGGTFVLPANANATLRFSGGTYSMPQIEPGTVSTSFDFRPFDKELAACQRYYEKSFPLATAPANNAGLTNYLPQPGAAGQMMVVGNFTFKVNKRNALSAVTLFNPSANNSQVRSLQANSDFSGCAANNITECGFGIAGTSPTGTIAGNSCAVNWAADNEL